MVCPKDDPGCSSLSDLWKGTKGVISDLWNTPINWEALPGVGVVIVVVVFGMFVLIAILASSGKPKADTVGQKLHRDLRRMRSRHEKLEEDGQD